MPLAVHPPLAPMEARSADVIPKGAGWQYEPKWDGFRCLAFREGAEVELQSKSAQSLTRYFPELVAALAQPGFTGAAPGGPSRWNRGKENTWQPLDPQLVVEVCYDHASERRFRHGTKLLRWRPDKAPRQCGLDQLTQKSADLLQLLG